MKRQYANALATHHAALIVHRFNPFDPERLPPNHERWMSDAVCRDSDPEAWFPNSGPPSSSNDVAIALCRACPVRRACLDYALSLPEDLHGIWGGLTASERKQLRRNRR